MSRLESIIWWFVEPHHACSVDHVKLRMLSWSTLVLLVVVMSLFPFPFTVWHDFRLVQSKIWVCNGFSQQYLHECQILFSLFIAGTISMLIVLPLPECRSHYRWPIFSWGDGVHGMPLSVLDAYVNGGFSCLFQFFSLMLYCLGSYPSSPYFCLVLIASMSIWILFSKTHIHSIGCCGWLERTGMLCECTNDCCGWLFQGFRGILIQLLCMCPSTVTPC